MAIDESQPTDKSQLVWQEGVSEESLESFLKRLPPSKTCRATGGDGWIWVVSGRNSSDQDSGPTAESMKQAKSTLIELVQRHEEIDRSATIPKVKSKTSGPSKKMLKEAASEQCEKDLRSIGEKRWPCGKWMFFETADYVDGVFTKLAQSVINGPLAKLNEANCHTIKVATSDSLRADNSRQGRGPQQLICLYFEDIWNEQHAKEVLDCVVKQNGEIPNSAKADLYTMIGLDSNHPAKLRSTLYRPSELYNWEQLREWQFEYRQKLLMGKKEASEDAAAGFREGSSSARRRDKDSDSSRKRRFGDDGTREPVDPAEFWPDPTDEQKNKTGTSFNGSKSNVVTTPNPDDSETEPESDSDRPPPISKSKESNAARAKNGAERKSLPSPSSPITPPKKHARQEPMASMDREREASASRSPEEKVKKTPQVVLKAKRRDRFGRSDF